MRRRWIALAALLLVATACTAEVGGTDTLARATAGTGESTDAADEQLAEATADVDQDADQSDADQGDAGSEAGSAETASPADDEAPTPDATMQALYDSFTLPEKGDPDAKVVLYEFSDYT
jgi:hypothetical protein